MKQHVVTEYRSTLSGIILLLECCSVIIEAERMSFIGRDQQVCFLRGLTNEGFAARIWLDPPPLLESPLRAPKQNLRGVRTIIFAIKLSFMVTIDKPTTQTPRAALMQKSHLGHFSAGVILEGGAPLSRVLVVPWYLYGELPEIGHGQWSCWKSC